MICVGYTMRCYIISNKWKFFSESTENLVTAGGFSHEKQSKAGKFITCSFALWWILISEILKQINVVQWHQRPLYIFISRTYHKMCLVLTKQHVNTVACLYLYYTINWVIIYGEESDTCLCYIHYNHDCNHEYFTM